MSQNARIGKRIERSSPMVSQVNVARISLRSQTIADWQSAINAARNETLPRRKQLLELYENLKLDAHLTAVMGKRTTNVTNKRIVWVEEDADDEHLERIREDILETPWFYDFITNSMEVVGWGTTVIELIPEGGIVSRCEVVPRANVVPEFGHITMDANNPMSRDLLYRVDPYWSTFLIEVGKPMDLGALMIALPYILYKRGALADWAQFAELFGMPFRVGKYNPYDESTRTKLLTALSEMGGAGYAVIPDGTSLDFQAASSGTGQGMIYQGMLEFCNAELSKLFLGNTMTTEQGQNGARSLGEVHQGVEEDIALADMRRVEFLLNWELKDRLERLGYPVANGRFAFDRTLNMAPGDRIKIDVQVAQQLGGLPASYWRETYNIPEPTPEELAELEAKGKAALEAAQKAEKEAAKKAPAKDAKEPTVEDPEPPEEGEKDVKKEAEKGQKKKPKQSGMSAALQSLYEPAHAHGFTAAKGKTFEGSDAIMDEIAQAMHDGRITDGYVDPKLMQWTADQLTAGLFDGFQVDDAADAQTKQLQDIMRDNVHVFSGFKTYQTLKAASDELMDEDGQFRSFSEFKKRILAIDQQYNVNYLRSEYELAVARGMAAEHWHAVQAEKGIFPWLRWSTAGDDRVRPVHAGLNGVEKPVDDEFWRTHWIPLEWGCRCDIEQLRRPSGNGKDLPRDKWPVSTPMFSGNVGIDGNVFPKGHPYFQAPPKVAKQVEKVVKAAKVPKAPKTTGTPAPMGTAVSNALATKSKGLKDTVARTLAAIDKVHGDGVLPEIPVLTTKASYFGVYRAWPNIAVDIKIRLSGDHKHVTLAHEIGHFIDHMALGRKLGQNYGSHGADPDMKAVMDALGKSSTMQHIKATVKAGITLDREGKEVRMGAESLKYWRYLIQPHEQWARAYSQYIAQRSGDEVMMKELNQELAKFGAPTQWPAEDFEPIAKEIDTLFQRKQWRTK